MTYEKRVWSGARDAGDQLTQSMKTDWILFDQILTEKGIPREVMIYPERYMDQENVKKRKFAIIEMHKRGISKGSLTSLCPYTMRHLDRILNGCASHGKEALSELNPRGPMEQI